MKGDVANLDRKVYTVSDSVEADKNRQDFSEENFRRIHYYESPSENSLSSRLKSTKCNKEWFLKIFPILQWLPKCSRKSLINDVIAGLTVAVMHIPQGMAYALLGGVPPILGIYTAFFPVLIYIIMGTSRHISMGTFAVICMMVGKSVDTYSLPHEKNLTEASQQDFFYRPPTPTEIASTVCFVVGVWQIILSVLKLGSLSVLLSQTLVSGFTTGAAIHVLTSQIKNLLGIKGQKYTGPLKLIYTYIDIFQKIKNLNTLATVLSASFISFLFIFNELIKPWLQKKFKRALPIPVELLVVIVGTLLSQKLNMKEEYGLAIVDTIPTGLPKPSLPLLNLWSGVAIDGLIIAIVAISINLSMASIFAQKLSYEIDANQEILASGVGNVFSSFFSCMPFAVSLSRSLIQQSVGGQTQIASVVSCVSLVFVLLFIGPFFEPLPYCVLSTIIVVALKGMLVQFAELPEICRNSKLDGLLWVATFLGVVLLDVDYGLGVGIIFSLLILLIYGQSAKVIVLGHIPNTQLYVDASRFTKSQNHAKILILQIIGGLHFANSAAVKKKILKLFSTFSRGFHVNSEKQSKCLYLVIDLSCVPFVDPSATKSLKMLYDDLKTLQSNLLLCSCVPSVYDFLNKSEHFYDFPKFLFFHSVNDAVEHAKGSENIHSLEEMTEYVAKF